MPCNDPGVYIDRSRNLAAGRGYVSSDERPGGVPEGNIYPADERRYKAKTDTEKKRLDFLSAKMCALLEFIGREKNSDKTCKELEHKFIFKDLDLYLWHAEHWEMDEQKKAKARKRAAK